MPRILKKLSIHKKFIKRRLLSATALLVIAICSSLIIGLLSGAMLTLIIGILYLLNKVVIRIANVGDAAKQKKDRNFDYLLLGSTVVWKNLSKKSVGRKIISFAFYNRSLFADYLILKHRFSYLSDNGVVVITVDCNNIDTCSSNKLFFPEIRMLHRITLKNLKIDRARLKYTSSFPLFFYPIYSIKLLIASLFPILNNGRSRQMKRNQREHIISLLLDMIEFCLQRELVPKLIFINYEARKDISEIQTEVSSRYNDVDSYLLLDVNQIFQVF